MILFILTSHRLDCFRLCIECLEAHTDLTRFDQIYVLANAPLPEHLAEAMAFMKRHANVRVVEFGPRGMFPLMRAQDTLLAQHKGEVLVKLDEDVFVMPRWLDGLVEVYTAYREVGGRLISALVPNNDIGRLVLHDNLCAAHADYAANPEFHRMDTSNNASFAVWLWQKVCADELQLTRSGLLRGLRVQPIIQYLNINCVLVDPEFWEMALPFGETTDEYMFNQVMRLAKGWKGLVSPWSLAHHYSFRHQQAAVDAAVSPEMIRPHLLGS